MPFAVQNTNTVTRDDHLCPVESYAIQGAVFDVYREMGCGFLEAVYQECLEREFRLRGIPFEAHKQLQLAYKGETLRQIYVPDFICYGKILFEIAALYIGSGMSMVVFTDTGMLFSINPYCLLKRLSTSHVPVFWATALSNFTSDTPLSPASCKLGSHSTQE